MPTSANDHFQRHVVGRRRLRRWRRLHHFKDKFLTEQRLWRQLHAWEMCNQLWQLHLPLNHIPIEQNWKFISKLVVTVVGQWSVAILPA